MRVRANGVHWQLIGTHPRVGRACRKLETSSEAGVLSAAIQTINGLDLGLARGSAKVGSNRGLGDMAVDRIRSQGLRTATELSRIARVREIESFLEGRQLKANELTLKLAVTELAPLVNRRRRAICTAARDVAISSKIELDVSGLQFK